MGRRMEIVPWGGRWRQPYGEVGDNPMGKSLEITLKGGWSQPYGEDGANPMRVVGDRWMWRIEITPREEGGDDPLGRMEMTLQR